MAVKKNSGRHIAKPSSQPEQRSPWKKLEFGDTRNSARPSMFEIIKPAEKKPAVKHPKPFNSIGRIAVPIPEESDEVKARRRLNSMIKDVKRKSIPPPPLRTIEENMRINKVEREIYDGEISIVEDEPDRMELSLEDIEEIKSLTTSFKEQSFFKTVLREIEDLLNKFEKKIDDILKL